MSVVSAPPRRRRAAALGAALVALVVLAVTVLAVMDKGYAGSHIQAHDGGVWVLNSQQSLLGRVNVDARELDARIRTEAPTDVLQSGSTVFVRTQDGVERIDPAAQRRESKTALGREDAVLLGGDRVVIRNAAGKLWILTPDQATGFDPTSVRPAATLGSSDAVIAASTGGDVYVLEHGVLTPYPRSSGSAAPRPGKAVHLEGVSTRAQDLSMTTVGDDVVVLDRAHGTLHVGSGDTVVDLGEAGIPDAASAVLQQPSVHGDGVLLATSDSLYDVPLRGGRAVRDRATGTGTPIAPVRAAGCAYAAWKVSATYLTHCSGRSTHTGRIERAGSDADLALRVNHELVALSDQATGTAWMIADQMQVVDQWQVTQPLDVTKQIQKKKDTLTSSVANVPPDQQPANRPPVANADSFGVRAGGRVVLPVVANDTDPDGDVLVASPVDQPTIGTVTPIRGGTALQIDVAPDASGSASFAYTVDDGREGGTASARVALDVHAATTNEPPRPEDDQDPTVTIAQGAEASFDVLPHVRDPDGDDFFLAGASVDGHDDTVSFRPDGMVTFSDAGLTTGVKVVALTFRDSAGATSAGRLLFDVVGGEDLQPITTPDHVTVVAGRTTSVKPLLNDLNPTGQDLELLHVSEAEGLKVSTDLRAGAVEVTGQSEGTRYLTYQTGAGAQSVTGVIRVDVRAPSSEAMAPVAVDDVAMVAAGGTVLVDPVENDVDPTGGVLVVDRPRLPDGAGVTAELIDHHLLRVSAPVDAARDQEPTTVSYDASNGTGTATGTVRVMVVPPETQMPYPVAVHDQAVVRAGDVARIPVLANDTSPSGAPLHLDGIADSSRVAGRGSVETAEDQVRFVADRGASGETTFSYAVADDTGRRATAEVTVRIVSEDDPNDAPQPASGQARALAGTTVRIPVATTGIDPDGDSTLLTSVTAPAPTLGRVVRASGESIEYEAYASSSGTDTLTYQVTDSHGAVGTAQISIGVARGSGQNLPPVTNPDTIRARPGRPLQMFVLANDTDPEGKALSIDKALTPHKQSLLLDVPDPAHAAPALTTTTPKTAGTYSIAYGASDGQNRAAGTATVIVADDAPLQPPRARDDYVEASAVTAARSGAVTVDVLANDEDPDGTVTGIVPVLDDPPAGVGVTAAGALSIPVTASPQRIRYTITDQDGQSASAFVWVPGSAAQAPQWIGPRIAAHAGQSVDIDLRDPAAVRVRAGAAGVTITDPSTARAEHSDGGELVTGTSTLRYTPRADYHGPDTISVDVTDGANAADPEGARGTLMIPVEVSSSSNLPPTLHGAVLDVEQGSAAIPYDLARGATDPDGDRLTFTRGSAALPAGVTATLTPAGQLSVEAGSAAAPGTVFDLPVSVDDGTNPPVQATVQVRVTGSQEALIATGVDDAVLDTGKETVVDVLANDSDPFPGKPRTITSVETVSGQVTGRLVGDRVALSAQRGFHGTATLLYRVQDATGDPSRTVTGTIRASVRDVPAAPAAPRVEAVGDGSVTLSVTPGADNGAPITGYVVRAASGGSARAACDGTTCTVTGLSNGTDYTFEAVATNAVGESPASSPSASARPDVRPDAPEAPQVGRGDGRLEVSWSAPADRGSAIQRYEVQRASASGDVETRLVEATSLSLVWTGLPNGAEQRFRIRALNGGREASEFSAWSRPEHPAGLPQRPPGTPRAERVTTALGGGVTVSFAPLTSVEANGEPITQYVVRSSTGLEQTVPANATTATFTGLNPNDAVYFTYVGVNSVGRGTSQSAPTNLVTPFSVPDAPTSVTASNDPSNPSGRARVSWSPPPAHGTGLQRYRITWQGGSKVVDASATSTTVDGLTDGTAYRFRVQADNGNDGGQSALSDESGSVVPYSAPQAPAVQGTGDACQGDSCTVTVTLTANGSGGADPVALAYSDDDGATFHPYAGPVRLDGVAPTRTIIARATNAKGLTADVTVSVQVLVTGRSEG